MQSISVVFMLVCSLILAGCGSKDYTTYSNDMKQSNATNALMATSYFENKAETDKIVMEKLQSNGNETAIVLYAILSRQEDHKIVAELKAMRIVKPMTTTEGIVSVTKSVVPTLIQWGFGYLIADGLFSNMGTQYNLQDGNLYQNSLNSGSFNAVKGNYEIPSNSHNTTTTTTTQIPYAPSSL